MKRTISALVIVDGQILVELCEPESKPYGDMLVLPTVEWPDNNSAEDCIQGILLYLIYVPAESVEELPLVVNFAELETIAHLYLAKLDSKPDLEDFTDGVMLVSLEDFAKSLANHDYPAKEMLELIMSIEKVIETKL